MRPYVVVFSTMTIDGRIADPTGFSSLSCEDDFNLQHKLRAWADAIVIGANTALRDNPRLNVRRAIGRSPIRVIVDGSLRVPPDLAALEVPGRSILVTVEGYGSDRLRPYLDKGVIVVERGQGEVDLAGALEQLHDSFNVRRVLVEGGGSTSYSFLEEGLVDELWVTVAPTAFGGGVSLLEGRGRSLRASLYLKGLRVLCGGWVNLRYGVLSPHRGVAENLPPGLSPEVKDESAQ